MERLTRGILVADHIEKYGGYAPVDVNGRHQFQHVYEAGEAALGA